MQHNKFRGNRFTGSREDFDEILPYMGVPAILISEQHHEKTNVLVSDLILHKPDCTAQKMARCLKFPI